MAVLASMVAGAMVFSSFTAPKQEKNVDFSDFSETSYYNDTWVSFGSYTGYDRDGKNSGYKFSVWGRSFNGRDVIEKTDFYWTLRDITPDKAMNQGEPYGNVIVAESGNCYVSFGGTVYSIDLQLR